VLDTDVSIECPARFSRPSSVDRPGQPTWNSGRQDWPAIYRVLACFGTGTVGHHVARFRQHRPARKAAPTSRSRPLPSVMGRLRSIGRVHLMFCHKTLSCCCRRGPEAQAHRQKTLAASRRPSPTAKLPAPLQRMQSSERLLSSTDTRENTAALCFDGKAFQHRANAPTSKVRPEVSCACHVYQGFASSAIDLPVRRVSRRTPMTFRAKTASRRLNDPSYYWR